MCQTCPVGAICNRTGLDIKPDGEYRSKGGRHADIEANVSTFILPWTTEAGAAVDSAYQDHWSVQLQQLTQMALKARHRIGPGLTKCACLKQNANQSNDGSSFCCAAQHWQSTSTGNATSNSTAASTNQKTARNLATAGRALAPTSPSDVTVEFIDEYSDEYSDKYSRECSLGYTGLMCSRCSTNYTRDLFDIGGKGPCVKCNDQAQNRL